MTIATDHPITRDPDLHSGAAVFTGTRVAVRILFDYLAEGLTIDDFVAAYPSVTRDQAIAALELVDGLLETAGR